MTTYNAAAVSDATIAFQKPITLQQGRGLRDNAISMVEGNGGAYVAAGWHPYDGVTIGDGADGVIYDFAVDGALNSVTSPDFVDGFEYLFRFDNISISNAQPIGVQWYLETSAAYSANYNITTWVSSSDRLWGDLTAHAPRAVSSGFRFSGDGVLQPFVNGVITRAAGATDILPGAVTRTTAQKILNAKFTIGAGEMFDSGTIRMFKQRCFV